LCGRVHPSAVTSIFLNERIVAGSTLVPLDPAEQVKTRSLQQLPMLQSRQPMEEPKVYVIHSRTDHGQWKSVEFSDKKIAKDFADALISSGFVVRFLTRSDKGGLEFEWEAVSERKSLA
jgi:hypothetical protein